MTVTSKLILRANADQTVKVDVVTSETDSTPLNMNGYTLAFTVRRTNDDLPVIQLTTSAGITIENGAATKDRATVAIADTDILATGNHYYGALWRTDAGSQNPFWEGPVEIRKVAAP